MIPSSRPPSNADLGLGKKKVAPGTLGAGLNPLRTTNDLILSKREVCLVDLSTPALIVVFWGRADEATLTNRNQPSQQVKKVMEYFQLDRNSSFLLWIEVSFASCNRCHKGLKRRFLDAVRFTFITMGLDLASLMIFATGFII